MGSEILSMFGGQKVLVTGDTGFKGAWLSFWLAELGADVTGLALAPEKPRGQKSLFEALDLGSRIKHIEGDIRAIEVVAEAFDCAQPAFVFHLAAQSLVRRSYEEPKSTFDTNVGGSLNILELIRQTSSVKSLIFVTSDKCYDNKEWTWGYRENDVLGGRDPYSASKAAAELVFNSFQQSFFNQQDGLAASSVRAGNVIGGGDWACDRFIPDCVCALARDEPVRMRNPHASRPWQHVLDPLFAYLLLAARQYEQPQRYSGSWNFGPLEQANCTVRELAKLILAKWGSGSIEECHDADSVHEATALQLNCDKAHRLLDWFPAWDLDRAVGETVSWYQQFFDGGDVREVTREQISRFVADIS